MESPGTAGTSTGKTKAISLNQKPAILDGVRINVKIAIHAGVLCGAAAAVGTMAAHQSPFHCDKRNLFSLLKKIVDSDYPPIPSNIYSDELRALVAVCIDPIPEKRRDISYASRVANQMHLRFSKRPPRRVTKNCTQMTPY
ncbi:hypothetical protein HPB47_011050 [Ixodes persulcatus]|uniref:Uncharacterized protein n=1 Tax=Ixodes persulcatus TaxID=34615 RepID=A0AC60NXD9_IXOPE|nr:hypothetical protein HPB47_011050 [Ixodes persulcatus]